MKYYPWDYRHYFSEKLSPHRFNFSDYIVKKLEQLPHAVHEILTLVIQQEINSILLEIEECESPIEQLLTIALYEVLKYESNFYISHQEEIKTKNNSYRVDMCIYIGDIEDLKACKKLVVECDGHDFHEKTKEQAMRDKKRDRDLIEAGYQIIHFTGSEIFADPFKCAREIRDLVNKMR